MKTRLITAFIGITLGILWAVLNNTVIFPLVTGMIAAGSIHEILNVADCGQKKYPAHYIMCMIMAVVLPFMTYYGADMLIRVIFVTVIVFLLFAGYVADNKKLSFDKVAIMTSVTCLITLSVNCLICLRNMSPVHGICYIVMALMGAWIPDSGAYFVGSALGKHKLCPEISPKKTVEGAIGGFVTTGIVFGIYGCVYQQIMHNFGVDFSVNYPAIIIIFMIGSVISIFGDLTASLLKREYNVKDYGKLMPGHGGVVDRFDSVYFVLPYITIAFTLVDIYF